MTVALMAAYWADLLATTMVAPRAGPLVRYLVDLMAASKVVKLADKKAACSVGSSAASWGDYSVEWKAAWTAAKRAGLSAGWWVASKVASRAVLMAAQTAAY